MAEILGQIVADDLKALPDRYNLAPSNMVPIVVLNEDDEPRLLIARWGLIPHWWKRPDPPPKTHNARSETAATKPMWRQAWRTQRCLIPASSWFEWFNAVDGTSSPLKIPHVLERSEGKEIFFAGLWSWSPPREDGSVIPTCAIVTVPSAPVIAEIHERTPVVLDPVHWLAWMDRSLQDPDQVRDLVVNGAVELFEMYTVGSEVNSGRASGPQLLEPKDWPQMREQGRADYSKEQLAWLGLAPPIDIQRELLRKLDDLDLGKMPSPAERRLWIRQLGDRDDAESLADLIKEIRATLRVAKPKPEAKAVKPPQDEPGQGSLF